MNAKRANDGRYDEIGYWSEVKLDVVKKYAVAYSTILTKKRLHHAYIDAFASSGVHVSRTTGEFVPGSPLNALSVNPPFDEYFLIDLDKLKVENLQQLAAQRPNVHVFEGDCNELLLKQVFPKVRREDYRRALCLLDPYAINLDWNVLLTAGQMGSVEIFLNFQVMDMNRNVLWRRNPEGVAPADIARMNRFWGDDSWRGAAYDAQPDLFGGETLEKLGNKQIAAAFQRRLKSVAGFAFVPEPIPMRNSVGAVVYYLFFASPHKVGGKIVGEIFDKYRDKGMS